MIPNKRHFFDREFKRRNTKKPQEYPTTNYNAKRGCLAVFSTAKFVDKLYIG